MAGYNKAIQVGYVVFDPELKLTPQGTAYVNFRIGVNSKTGGGKDESFFLDVTAWEKTAEACANYLKKGSLCLVEGRLVCDTWEKDGQKREKIKIVANTVQFLDSKNSSKKEEAEDIASDDIPF